MIRWFLIIVGVIILMAVMGVFYVVPETEQAIITQFGKPVGNPVTTAGLKMKVPFIQEVHRIQKRVLPWDGPTAEMPTRDKLYIVVDAFGRWRIGDPLRFFLRLRDPRTAQSRLDDILGSEMRNTIARHDLVEVIRTTKDRKPAEDAAIVEGAPGAYLPPIRLGRVTLEKEVFENAKDKLLEFGVELLDVRFKRINYNPAVASKIFDRMISERTQIAERFRSEGAGEAAKILGNKERDLRRIASEAYQQVEKMKGKADAEATAIYASAYNTPEAQEFYEFLRSLEMYQASFGKDTTTVLTTNSPLLRFLKGPGTLSTPGPQKSPAPPQPPAPTPTPAPLEQ